MDKRYTGKTFAWEIFMILVVLIFSIPFYVLIINAFKTTKEVYVNPVGLPSSFNIQSFIDVFKGAGINADFSGALISSLVITAGALVFLVLIGSITAYGIARNKGILTTLAYMLCVVGIIIPSQLGLIPMYAVLRTLHLVGTYPGMIFLYVCKEMPMTIFLYTGFFKQLPISYEEAALLDGARFSDMFMKVVMPQMRSITGTVLLLNSLYIWNDTFDQIVFLNGSKIKTLPAIIYSLTGSYLSQWNIIFAAVIISLLPMVILYLFTQKKMMVSLGGGLKG